MDKRLQVYVDGEWGTVCDDEWTDLNSLVACRQLGYRFVDKSYTVTEELVQGPIFLDNVNCAGTEDRLIDCPANPVGETDCFHFEDRVVECVDGKWVEEDNHSHLVLFRSSCNTFFHLMCHFTLTIN